MKNWSAKQWTRIGGLGILLWVVVYTLEVLIGGPFPVLSLGLLGMGLLALGVLIYRKLIIQFQDTRQQVHASTSQVEALWYFFQKVSPRKALPRMRGYAASPDFLNQMIDLVETQQPKLIVECGAGLSTIVNAYLTEAWPKTQVIGLDHSAEYAAKTKANLADHGFTEEKAKVVHAPLKSYQIAGTSWKWYDFPGSEGLEKGSIDLLIIDGPPVHIQSMARYPALPLLDEYLSSRARILIDDGFRPDDTAMVHRWLKEFPGWELAQTIPTEKGAYILKRVDRN
ncbi:MAG: class I SAM-dependent methyltransferase [Bacteroidota bacterium]